MRGEGESHLYLVNSSVQKMIKLIPVNAMFLPGLLECWSSIGCAWIHALYFLNKYWICILSRQERWPLLNSFISFLYF